MMREAATPAQAEGMRLFASAASAAAISTVVYRSRAVADMSPPALRDLTRVSQARNGREEITGLMLYDNGRFFQWLEGPTGNVDRVMNSICRDSRHTEIEVLNNQPAPERTFGEWTMKLATQVPSVNPWRKDVIEPPREIIEGLRKRPEAAPVLLKKLVEPPSAVTAYAAEEATGQLKLNDNAAALLKNIFLSVVIPHLVSDGCSDAVAPPSGRVADLAELLIGADHDAALELIRELHGAGGRTGLLYSTLLEPAARSLGDLWSEDICSEFDLTLGLCRLQTAVRLLTADSVLALPSHLPQPVVLIVPEPGELHRLGAALDGTILGNAGWAPHSEYPTDDRALQDLLSSSWFDVLDLSLSVALRRDHLLPRVTETIARARRASQNPSLLVVVGGRVFVEKSNAGTNVGADLAAKTSGTVDRAILRAFSETKTNTETMQALPTPS